jgi:cell wall-associated NlpC family hydrolase
MPRRLLRISFAFVLAAGVAVVASGSGASFAAARPEAAVMPPASIDLKPERLVEYEPMKPERPVYDHTPPPRPLGERVATIALRAVGIPYRWGGESPESGFDCSGLVRWSYGKFGIDLPHSSYALYSEGRSVEHAQMEAGDVLIFSGLGHVGLYLGRDRMVHAPQTGRNVEVVPLSESHYGGRLVAVRRVTRR